MRILGVLLAASGVFAGLYSGDKIIRVETPTDDVRAKFMEMAQQQDIDVLSVWEDHIEVHIPNQQLQAVSFASMGFNASTVHEDVQQVSDNLFQNWVCDPEKEACATDDFYLRYQPLTVIEQRVREWTAANGRFVRENTIGTSHLGRPIRGYILTSPAGNPDDKLKAFYNCGIHAREWLPVPFCIWLGEKLVEKYETDATAKLILDNFVIHVVPVLNVDGYLHTFTGANMWRKSRKPNTGSTCIGTDLNRNLPYMWGTGGSSNNPCSDTFMGARPLDNPETDALNRYVGQLRPIVYMDIHASGLMWLAPLGFRPRSACPGGPRGCGVDDDNAYRLYMECGQRSADAIFDVHGSRFRVGPITFIIYQASGSTVDQMHMVNGVRFPYSPEVRAGFQPPPANIILSNEELEAGVFAQLEYAYHNSD